MIKTFLFNNTCTFMRVPEGTDDTAREVVAANVPCSRVYPPVSGIYAFEKQQQERGTFGQLVQTKIVYTMVPNVPVTQAMRLSIKDKEYGIRDISQWTDDEPNFLEILVEVE